ncbi:MAG: transpeptidase family protein [Flavobacteriales bacterium]|nr:transpeptidase family protein [Flavobacteriales bacterium]
MSKSKIFPGKMDVKKDILWRVYLVYFFICMLGLGIIYKTFQIQYVEGDKWRALAETSTTEIRKIEAVRGNIYASNGMLLATSIPNYEIAFDTGLPALTDEIFNANVDSLAFHLAILFPRKTERQYRKELVRARRKGARYHMIQRSANYNQLKTLKQFPICRLGRYRGGFIYKQINRRQKPFKQLAARTIGFDRPNVRPVGLEGAYAKYLRGVDGHRLEQKISGGVWKPIHDALEVEPQDGSDVITTIDVNIQDVAHNALEYQLTKNDADHGCVVLMEVKTGEIKAISNLKRSKSGAYYEWYNYAVGESTEPGSTFKLAAFIAAIEDGHLTLEDTVDTEDGSVQFYDQVMHDSHRGGYGVITVKEAFQKSSNVALSKLLSRCYKNNPQQFVDRLYKMGLNDPLGIDIAGEGAPMIKKPRDKDWSGITLPWMAVGYEVKQTPLQILTFYNAVANDGRMVKPQFIKEIKRRGKVIKSFPTEVLNESICSRSTIAQAKIMLEAVITEGTGKNLQNSTYRIAGKTGTARIANGKYGYKYEGKYSYQASFCGYFPAENPKYSCIVVVNAPSKNVYYGNQVAGPIFRDIADKVYASSIEIHENLVDQDPGGWAHREDGTSPMPYVTYGLQDDLEYVLSALDIPAEYQDRDSRWAVALPRDSSVSIEVRNLDEDIESGKVPNVVGMTAQDAIYMLENAGLKVRIVGGGMIVKQSIEAGTRIDNGSEIILELA